MNATDRETLERLLAKPTPTDIDWADIESMLRGVGVSVRDRPASRVALVKDGEIMVLCRPHPESLAVRATVRDVVSFLKVVGVTP